ncbi:MULTISPECIES: dienelactone hydrolase family protein [Ramlibacter]|uniref:Prolyl oligopeptidase family serine peptidase n=1 Tax=Ramlibacter pinisoli TaxID=2682844 RepID=A0A6N8J2W5_9BURK|nr:MULTISPECIES: CocE/NonD family hydrolase [Ramlibacter]MBA2962708.1 prolyl oligopeptidase family serine peptidase [Ramlibacter sp. CGMCC 1.13660]MVQ32650.1 prolyl oligopeptidase family serine peptidase [Ramlibacter pinisoli]
MPIQRLSSMLLLWVAGLLGCGPAGAQAPQLDAALNEAVVMVAKTGTLFSTEIETTVYKPDGDGPFPLVLVNHGKAHGDPRFQSRYRPALAARYFLQRGYAVLVPMRQGFSRSSGSYIGGGCNVESNGRVQAQDLRVVLDWAGSQPWADRARIVVVGQSHGGWTTLAFGAENYPGVRGLVNFAGGLRQDGCAGWQRTLAVAAGSYASQTRVPSLWFYGENDSYFQPDLSAAMLERYLGGGGQARLVAFGTFGSDAHAMFGSRAGLPIWQPEVTAFLAALGLPSEVQPQFARYGARARSAATASEAAP